MDVLKKFLRKSTSKRKFPRKEITRDVVDLLKTISSQCEYLLEFDLKLDNAYYFFIEPVEDVKPIFFIPIVLRNFNLEYAIN
jgi:hypothetical protein